MTNHCQAEEPNSLGLPREISTSMVVHTGKRIALQLIVVVQLCMETSILDQIIQEIYMHNQTHHNVVSLKTIITYHKKFK